MTDIATIRTPGNWSDVYILIDAPTVIYRAHATGAVNQTTWTIGFTEDGTWTEANCLADMTLLIGTAEGGCDLGIARLRRNLVSGTFYIGADPRLVVAAGNHLTVVDDFEPFSKHPVGVLLDVDRAYAGEFASFDPIPHFGGRCKVIKEAGTAYFNAARSWVPGAGAITYAWLFPGATSYAGEDTATPTAHYHTSGRYRVALTVTSGGKSFTGYGYIFVRGANLPDEPDFLCDGIEVDYMAGGSCTVEMLDRPTIRDGARVIIFADDWYSGVNQSFGPVLGSENILLEGRILGETIKRQPGVDTVEFEIGGPIAILEEIAAAPAGLCDSNLPVDKGQTPLTAWATMSSLSVYKGLHYLAHLRSTISRCLDFFVEDWDWRIHKLTSEADTLFPQLAAFAARAALEVRADQFGCIYVERDGQLFPLIYRTPLISVVFTLADGDWQDQLSITRRQRGDISTAKAEGVIYASGIVTPVGGRAPGDQPAQHGQPASLSDLGVTLQYDVLELAGLLAGSQNGEIEAISANLIYNNRLATVTPRSFVDVVVDGDTLRCFPRNIRFRKEEGTGWWHSEIDLEPEGTQWPAVAITYPGEDEPPVEPPTEPPTLPPEPPGGGVEPPEEPSPADAVVSTIDDVRTSADFDEVNPAWTSEL